jgi:hypothetical protein
MGTKKIAVTGGPNWTMDGATLREVFSAGGLKVLDSAVTTGARGFKLGTVQFSRFEDAESAIADYDRALVDGVEIRVRAYREEGGRREEGGGAGAVRGGGAGAVRGGGAGEIVVKKAGNRVRVSGLPPDLSAEELSSIFRESGRILDAKVGRGGTGFLEFQAVEGAKKAIKEFDGAEVNGSVIEVAYASKV